MNTGLLALAGSSPERSANTKPPVDPSEDLERLCLRNLLASQERVYFKDLHGRFLLVSEGMLQGPCLGRTREEVIGKTDFDIFSQEHALRALGDEEKVIRTGEEMVRRIERETYHDRPDAWVSTSKMPLIGNAGQIIGTFGISRDVTTQIEFQTALAHQALHDPVTGLPNRVALTERIVESLARLEQRSDRIAVLFVDLDDFKEINDNFGHETGDRVLVEVAQRLRQVARGADTVARFGGDEFVLLCDAVGGDGDVREIATRAMDAVRRPIIDRKRELVVTASIGAVTTNSAGAKPGELLRHADIAMYAAKRAGRDRLAIYDRRLQRSERQGLFRAAELRDAIKRGQLAVRYQPLFGLADGGVRGVEALARWEHPKHGTLLPSRFIPMAEEHGVVGAVDDYVLDRACAQLAEWNGRGSALDDLTMAVNLSGWSLRDDGVVDRVAAALDRHGVSPERLHVEITESPFVSELATVRRTIGALGALGVRIALDDFGTGCSTLTRLHQLSADIMKIDRTFVTGAHEPRTRAILAGVISTAHALGMTVVGEGIETELQREELRSLRCDLGQGFLFAGPLDARDVAALTLASTAAPG